MRIQALATTLSLTALFAAGAASAATITLTGTVRDFQDTHPNFEEPGDSGINPGAVESTLGADGTPVFNTAYSGSDFTNAADFNDWYHDTAANQSRSLSITLDNGGSGNVYSYSDSSFFPIDDELFGNEGRSHNYHFTFELHSAFTYQPGQSFTFTGDDDLWVFLNDQLVIDLGGIHPAATGSVDLDTLGLTAGDNYDFDLFFAERHTTQSNFAIETSIAFRRTTAVPEPGILSLMGLGLGSLFLVAGLRRNRRRLTVSG